MRVHVILFAKMCERNLVQQININCCVKIGRSPRETLDLLKHGTSFG